MSEPRVLILTGLGLNCEAETEAAFAMAGARPEKVHLLDLLDGSATRKLADYPLLAFIGGFAFGDHLGAGAVFANKIRWRLYDDLLAFIEKGGLALGICNGFQTMVRLGLLPGLDRDFKTPRATLAPNDRPGYRDAWVTLGFDLASPCVWTRGIRTMELPSRHGEGKFITSSSIAERLDAEHLVVARYLAPDGAPTTTWPFNPNGSAGAVAGVCDPSGRLFGLMPHPDAYLYPFHHPQWSKRKLATALPREGDGMRLFRNGVEAAKG
jgi:phosphoribosylformylglycinamidine synthase